MPRPNLFILGAPKCGTTAMCRYLEVHPEVFVAPRKDVHYFGSDLGFRGKEPIDEAGYLTHFAEAGSESWVGEASVWYLYSQRAAAELDAFSPHGRAIVMLRNPVEVMHALHSQYLLNGLGDEDIDDFEVALAAQVDRAAGRRIPPHNRLPESLQYRTVVRFHDQVARAFETLGRDRVRVVLQDDLKADTAGAVRGVYSWLGVDDTVIPELDRVNSNKVVRSKTLRKAVALTPSGAKDLLPTGLRQGLRKRLRKLNSRHAKRAPLDPALRARLTAELRPEVEALAELIDRDLSAWTELSPSHSP